MLYKAKLMDCNKTDRNGHLYMSESIKKAIKKFLKKKDNKIGVFHVDNNIQYSSYVNLIDISHEIIDLSYNNDDTVTVIIDVLDTPAGKLAQNFLSSNIDLAPCMNSVINNLNGDVSIDRIDIMLAEYCVWKNCNLIPVITN